MKGGNNKEETFKEELLSHSWSSARNEWARLNSVTRVVITSLKCAVFAARQAETNLWTQQNTAENLFYFKYVLIFFKGE